MIQGVDQGVDGVIFVGYHARAGSQNAILDHTWSSRRVANLWLNDILVGEYGLNGAVAGHFNVPVLMLSGDQTACSQASELLGKIETVVVKTAISRMAAECLPPQTTQERIQNAAKQAVERLRQGDAPKPFVLATPVHVTIDYNTSEQADQAALLPGSTRLDGRRLTFTADSMLVAYFAFQAAVALAIVYFLYQHLQDRSGVINPTSKSSHPALSTMDGELLMDIPPFVSLLSQQASPLPLKIP
jgi:D-amino peptidase